MYSFTTYKNHEDVVYKGLNGTNQMMRMEFQKWYYPYDHRDMYYVKFYITNKRKHEFKFKQQTGTDGIKSLLWAKECLINFISEKINNNKENIIVVYWDDRRRRDVYIKGLTPLGFKLQLSDRREALVLKIDKNK